MHRKHTSHVAVVLGAAAITALVGVAPLPVIVRDRFSDNAINQNLWDIHTLGGLSVAETSNRLQFSGNGPTGALSFAGLEVENWGVRWRDDFEIELDYKVDLANVTGNRQVIVGIGLALGGQYPQNFTGFAGEVVRDDGGLTFRLGRYSNGALVAADTVGITATSGQITVEYDRSDDRLDARVNDQEVHLNGIWAQFGAGFGSQPMVISVGCTSRGGNISFPGTRVYADEFKFDGIKKAR